MDWLRKWFMEIRIVLLFFILVMLLWSIEGRSQNLEQYRPLAMIFCEDVQLRCALMIPKDTDLFYAVFSEEGKLIAITKVDKTGKETIVWGKLRKKGEVEL